MQAQSPNSYEFYIIDNLHPQVHKSGHWPKDVPEGVVKIQGDVSEPLVWDNYLETATPDIIIHLAAETGTGQSLTESTRHGTVNVVGTTAMIDALHRHGKKPEQIVLASSRAVYGDGLWQYADGTQHYVGARTHAQLEAKQWNYIDAEGTAAKYIPARADITHPQPTNIYAATKLAQEHILSAWCNSFEVSLTILRFQNVYGPGQALDNSYTGIVALFSRLSYEKQPIQVYEDGNIIRDFVYVLDVSRSIEKAITTPGASGYVRTYDVGSGKSMTVQDIARQLSQIGNAPEPVVVEKYRDGDVRAAACDISVIRSELGYNPEWPVGRGLEQLYEWVKETSAS